MKDNIQNVIILDGLYLIVSSNNELLFDKFIAF